MGMICVCVCVNAGDHHKRASDSPRAELMVFVKLLTWVLGTEFSSERAVHSLNCLGISLAINILLMDGKDMCSFSIKTIACIKGFLKQAY